MYKTVSKFMQRRLAQGYVSLDSNKRVRTGGKPAFKPVPDGLKKAFQSKTFVNGRVSSKVKGGYRVKINGYLAFCPASEMHPKVISSTTLAHLKRTSQPYAVIDVSSISVVVSRRRAAAAVAWENAKRASARGTTLLGTVINIQAYGLFVDLDGVTGLAHISKTPCRCPEDLKRKYKAGQIVDVIVLEVIDEGKRLSLCVRD